MVSGLMLCHLDAWGKCQGITKEQRTCCKGRQWHCSVPEAFRFIHHVSLERMSRNNISQSFPCSHSVFSKNIVLIALQTPRGCFFSYLNPPFPSKEPQPYALTALFALRYVRQIQILERRHGHGSC